MVRCQVRILKGRISMRVGRHWRRWTARGMLADGSHAARPWILRARATGLRWLGHVAARVQAVAAKHFAHLSKLRVRAMPTTVHVPATCSS